MRARGSRLALRPLPSGNSAPRPGSPLASRLSPLYSRQLQPAKPCAAKTRLHTRSPEATVHTSGPPPSPQRETEILTLASVTKQSLSSLSTLEAPTSADTVWTLASVRGAFCSRRLTRRDETTQSSRHVAMKSLAAACLPAIHPSIHPWGAQRVNTMDGDRTKGDARMGLSPTSQKSPSIGRVACRTFRLHDTLACQSLLDHVGQDAPRSPSGCKHMCTYYYTHTLSLSLMMQRPELYLASFSPGVTTALYTSLSSCPTSLPDRPSTALVPTRVLAVSQLHDPSQHDRLHDAVFPGSSTYGSRSPSSCLPDFKISIVSSLSGALGCASLLCSRPSCAGLDEVATLGS